MDYPKSAWDRERRRFHMKRATLSLREQRERQRFERDEMRRNYIAGTLIRRVANGNPGVARLLLGMLDAHLRTRRDRGLFGLPPWRRGRQPLDIPVEKPVMGVNGWLCSQFHRECLI